MNFLNNLFGSIFEIQGVAANPEKSKSPSGRSGNAVVKNSSNRASSTLSDDEDDLNNENFDVSSYLDQDERKMLRTFYDKSFDSVKNSFTEEPPFCHENYLCQKIVYYLNHSKSVNSFESFEKFVIECVRIGSTKSFEMIWKISTADVTDPMDVELKMFHFLRFMFHLSVDTSSLSESSISSHCKNFLEFYTTRIAIADPDYKREFDKDNFLGLVNSFSCQGARAFQSFMIANFLGGLKSTSSFKVFAPITLKEKTDILSPKVMSFLSLYTDELQGKRLYSFRIIVSLSSLIC
jgi:hypothetical protein